MHASVCVFMARQTKIAIGLVVYDVATPAATAKDTKPATRPQWGQLLSNKACARKYTTAHTLTHICIHIRTQLHSHVLATTEAPHVAFAAFWAASAGSCRLSTKEIRNCAIVVGGNNTRACMQHRNVGVSACVCVLCVSPAFDCQ